jgi:hypothetical protein
MYADAVALGKIAKLIGNKEKESLYNGKAQTIKQ